MTNEQDEKFLSTHFTVLELLLSGLSFPEIMDKLSAEFEELNYVKRAKQINFLTMDQKNNLLAAYPVSPFKTNFKVKIDNIGFGYAMCAIDALGIGYTFMEKTTIFSKTNDEDPEDVLITIDPITDAIEYNKEFFVSYKNPELVQNIALDQCPVINFYSKKDSVCNPDLIVFNFEDARNHAKLIFSIEAFKKNMRSGFKAIEGKNL